MSGRSIFDQPTTPRIFQLIEDVSKGHILIPAFQRPFEWDDDRRLQLFDSISRGIPIGNLMVWRTLENSIETFPSLGGFRLPQPDSGEVKVHQPKTYLLDGHQRLSTLFAALYWNDADVPMEEGVRWPIWFDADASSTSMAFTLKKRSGQHPLTFVPLDIVFSPRRLWRHTNAMRKDSLHEAADRVEVLVNALKDYQIPIVPLVSEDLDRVTDSFVRINRQGMRMQESYMLQALAYSRFKIRDRTEELRRRLSALGWGDLDDQYLVNALKLRWRLDVYSAGPKRLIKEFERLQKEADERQVACDHAFEVVFDELERCLREAVRLLAKCGVRGSKSLPYAYQLLAFVEVFRRAREERCLLDAATEQRMMDWFWVTTYLATFTGLPGNRIRDEIDCLWDEIVLGGREAPGLFTSEEAVSPLNRYYFQATRTKAFLLLLLHHNTALDLRKRAERDLGLLGTEAVHKIHPKLAASNPASHVVCALEDLQELREAIENPNHARREALLKAHMIPLDAADALVAGEYELFMRRRIAALVEVESEFLGRLGLNLEAQAP